MKIIARIILTIFVFSGLLMPKWSIQAGHGITQDGQIAFISRQAENSEIYLVNGDGSQQTQLTFSPENEESPGWSPDGKRIAFIIPGDKKAGLFIMDSDGQNRIQLSQDNEIITKYAWSPDGSEIAYVTRTQPDTHTSIDVVDIKSKNIRNLVSEPSMDCFEPGWSPDGKLVAYACFPIPYETLEAGLLKSQVYTIHQDGTGKKKLIPDNSSGDHAPSWSPDGSKIAFSKVDAQGDGSNSGIFVINPDGTGLIRLSSHQGDTDPGWSPDGSHIAFISSQALGTEVYTVHPDGTDLILIINKLPNPRIMWSPDNTRIAISFADDQSEYSGQYGVYTIHSDGTELTPISDTKGADSSPDWSNKSIQGQIYQISGQVVDGNRNPLKGVKITTQNGQNAETGADGVYQIANLAGGITYSIRPSLNGFIFEPNLKTVTVPPEASGVDFRTVSQSGVQINNIEVIQTVQDSQVDPQFPYIEAKPTLVRVYIICEGDCQTQSALKATLSAYNPEGGELGSLTTDTIDISTPHSNWKDQQGKPSETYNFILPSEWIKGKVRLVASVGGSVSEKTVDFQPGKKISIAWLMLPYEYNRPDAENNQVSTEIALPDKKIAVQSILQLLDQYPVSSNDVLYTYQPFWQQIMKVPFSCQFSSTDPGTCPAYNQYIQLLRVFWERMNREGLWVGNHFPDRLYAWIPDVAQSSTCGMSDGLGLSNSNTSSKGRVAIGVDKCTSNFKAIAGEDIFTHQIGYLQNSKGLLSSPSEGPEVNAACYRSMPNKNNYPQIPGLPVGSINAWGMRLKNGYEIELFDPSSTYDLMSFCSPTWTSPFTFQNLNFGFGTASIHTPIVIKQQIGKQLAAPAMVNPMVANEEQVLISGTVTRDGKGIFNPIYSLSSREPSSSGGEGAYCVELRNGSGQPLDSTCFDLNFINPDTGDPLGAESFVVSLMNTADAQSLVLVKNQSDELFRMNATVGVPQVQLINPNGGENWKTSQSYTVSWQASDADGDALHYSISLSNDGGLTWNPLVLDTTSLSVLIDPGQLPGSKQAMIRVQASDGFHSSSDSSNAVFSIDTKPPTVYILTPGDDVVIPAGQSIWLRGYAEDPQDGNLGYDSLTWNSDQIGDLGKGNQINVTLPAGEHVITLTASGSDGQNANARVKVTSQTQKVNDKVNINPIAPILPNPSNIQKIVIRSEVIIPGMIALCGSILFLVLVFLGIRKLLQWRRDKVTEQRLESITSDNELHTTAPIRSQEHTPGAIESEPIGSPGGSGVDTSHTVVQDQHVQNINDASSNQFVTPIIEDGSQSSLNAGIEDIKAGRINAGYQKLRALISHDPQNAEAWLWLGWAAAQNKDVATAQRCFERADQLGHPGAAKANLWLQKNIPKG